MKVMPIDAGTGRQPENISKTKRKPHLLLPYSLQNDESHRYSKNECRSFFLFYVDL